MIILFSIFVSRAQKETDVKSKSGQNAVAVFSFFLFLVYGLFGSILFIYREALNGDLENFEKNEIQDSIAVRPKENQWDHFCVILKWYVELYEDVSEFWVIGFMGRFKWDSDGLV